MRYQYLQKQPVVKSSVKKVFLAADGAMKLACPNDQHPL